MEWRASSAWLHKTLLWKQASDTGHSNLSLCPRIFSVLSAILYLGNVTYKKRATGRDEGLEVGPPEVLDTLSELLKVPPVSSALPCPCFLVPGMVGQDKWRSICLQPVSCVVSEMSLLAAVCVSDCINCGRRGPGWLRFYLLTDRKHSDLTSACGHSLHGLLHPGIHTQISM